jgi:hypothetical protein
MPKGVYFITDSSFGRHEELAKRALDLGVNERHGMGGAVSPPNRQMRLVAKSPS